jgi:hypothetical protein
MMLKKLVKVCFIFAMFCLPVFLNATGRKNVIPISNENNSVLWHYLTNQPMNDEEKLEIFEQGRYTDEFDRRRKLKDAESKYDEYRSEISKDSIFSVNLDIEIGPYDFKTKSYPLFLYNGENILYDGENASFIGGGSTNWYNVAEEMRTVEMDEKMAEKVQPRINDSYNKVIVELMLKPVLANTNTSFNSTAIGRNIFFKVESMKVFIPGQKSYDDHKAKPEIILKFWKSGKKIKNTLELTLIVTKTIQQECTATKLAGS